MKILSPATRAGRSAASLRRYVILALCALLLTVIVVSSSAQRRVAIRVPVGEAPAAATAPRPEAEGHRETNAERLREATEARKKAQERLTRLQVTGQKGIQKPPVSGIPTKGEMGVKRTTADIMQSQSYEPQVLRQPRLMLEHEMPDRRVLPQDPNSKPLARTPSNGISGVRGARAADVAAPSAPQTVGTTFTGATLADTGAFPPDSMGAVGPTQFVVFVNGRIRTFNKTSGAADGVINADPDVFFNSVFTPANVNFTSDPNVRYDRLSGRWFMTIIEVPSTSGASLGDTPNRILIAVSDAASNGVISAGTVWTFFFVQQNTLGGGDTGEFLDYPSLGIDANALYIGGNMFGTGSPNFNFKGCSAFVIRKSSVTGAGPIVATAFRGLIPNVSTSDGMLTPRGVDNYDATATEGYFIGVSNSTFGRLILRRVSSPGGTPTISGDILIPVANTYFPVPVDHLGNANVADLDLDGFADGTLDSLDDRLYAAHIRNGRLWTAHNIAVDAAGVRSVWNDGTSNTVARNGVRWYELNGIRSTDNGGSGVGVPVVAQFGTIFDPAAQRATARQYWIPSVAVSGQGHVAIGYSTAGTTSRIDAATSGRLRTDTSGTTGAVNIYTATTGVYNPGSDTGPPRRWGDYSFTSLDPKDDMTMWTIQEFCDANNSYGVRIAKLAAPPPAKPSGVSQIVIPAGLPSFPLTVTGTSISGSEFYDPGANLAAPALPFNHITASVSGGVTVNSVTYTDPTHVTLDLNTVGAALGAKTITITNPDGQSTASNSNIAFVGSGPLLISEFRFRGPASAADEYVELYNNTNATLDISGYTLWALTSAGAQNLRFTVPGALGSNTTVIPARGHYLITGASYTLAAYAASNGALSTGIVDSSSIAVFAGATPTAATRLDSVGFDTRDALFFEGTALTPTNTATGTNASNGGIVTPGEYAFVRKMTAASGNLPQDTENNQNDFAFVSITAGVFSTRQSTLGAPGPENLASPIQRNSQFALTLLDPGVGSSASPNRGRDTTSDPINNSTFGTMSIRRTVTNNTGANVTKLRFRVVDITTSPVPAGVADLRVRTST
ncbi:MAG: hypothetical protein QOE46_3041, partial [Acidobacteriota bacterium]|nr:hypothetical protein [Acidobacteriota bacterium]